MSISILTEQNGILTKTTEAMEETNGAQEKEMNTLISYENYINEYTSELPLNTVTKPYLPGSNFKYKEGDLDNGVVIADEAENEYVWIEVPITTKIYVKTGLDVKDFTKSVYENIESDLYNYTLNYRKNTDFSDVYYEAKDDSKEKNKQDWFQSEEEYNALKQKMLKSIYENGGFWIGRYEAGIEKEDDVRKTTTDFATLIPVSKQNMYPYNWVTRTQAKKLAEQVEAGNCTSCLMFGIQWDLVLKFIEEKSVAKTEESNKEVIRTSIIKTFNEESIEIGNYKNYLWNITNQNAKYSENDGQNYSNGIKKKERERPIILSTGADESFKLINIYDIAGNMWEWTLERGTDLDKVCIIRGGSYYNSSYIFPTSYRYAYNTSSSYYNVGFRISIVK